MDDENDTSFPPATWSAMAAALDAVPDIERIIAGELRQMAEGQGNYAALRQTPLQFRYIWRAAATLLDRKK